MGSPPVHRFHVSHEFTNLIGYDGGRLIDKWDNRAAAFFASFSFALATLGTNVRLPSPPNSPIHILDWLW